MGIQYDLYIVTFNYYNLRKSFKMWQRQAFRWLGTAMNQLFAEECSWKKHIKKLTCYSQFFKIR